MLRSQTVMSCCSFIGPLTNISTRSRSMKKLEWRHLFDVFDALDGTLAFMWMMAVGIDPGVSTRGEVPYLGTAVSLGSRLSYTENLDYRDQDWMDAPKQICADVTIHTCPNLCVNCWRFGYGWVITSHMKMKTLIRLLIMSLPERALASLSFSFALPSTLIWLDRMSVDLRTNVWI